MEAQTQTQQATEAPLKYAQLLAQSKDQKDEAERQLNVEEAQQDLDSAILNQKRSISGATRRLAEIKGRFPLDIDGIADAKQELRDLQAGLDDLNALKVELF